MSRRSGWLISRRYRNQQRVLAALASAGNHPAQWCDADDLPRVTRLRAATVRRALWRLQALGQVQDATTADDPPRRLYRLAQR